eukprot:TRINITY_DN11892_c0_g1_i1.p1 TRINITY_DN11892_c0_g1~~TRINITY_DN11892_c0_g1_i1.p1  ORF type:complete len:1137 (+),score=267.23 TRINITY_DN11892_c0_g1_i1:143-3553(+)
MLERQRTLDGDVTEENQDDQERSGTSDSATQCQSGAPSAGQSKSTTDSNDVVPSGGQGGGGGGGGQRGGGEAKPEDGAASPQLVPSLSLNTDLSSNADSEQAMHHTQSSPAFSLPSSCPSSLRPSGFGFERSDSKTLTAGLDPVKETKEENGETTNPLRKMVKAYTSSNMLDTLSPLASPTGRRSSQGKRLSISTFRDPTSARAVEAKKESANGFHLRQTSTTELSTEGLLEAVDARLRALEDVPRSLATITDTLSRVLQSLQEMTGGSVGTPERRISFLDGVVPRAARVGSIPQPQAPRKSICSSEISNGGGRPSLAELNEGKAPRSPTNAESRQATNEVAGGLEEAMVGDAPRVGGVLTRRTSVTSNSAAALLRIPMHSSVGSRRPSMFSNHSAQHHAALALDVARSVTSLGGLAGMNGVGQSMANLSRRPSVDTHMSGTHSQIDLQEQLSNNFAFNTTLMNHREMTPSVCSDGSISPMSSPKRPPVHRTVMKSHTQDSLAEGMPPSPTFLKAQRTPFETDEECETPRSRDSDPAAWGGPGEAMRSQISAASDLHPRPVSKSFTDVMKGLDDASRPSGNRLTLREGSGTDCRQAAIARSLTRVLEDDEGKGRSTSTCCIIEPQSPVRLVWDVIVIAVVLFSGITIPLGLGYLGNSAFTDGLTGAIFLVADIVWPIDVILNFRTGLIINGRKIMDPRRIAREYARRSLTIDLLAAWPLMLTPEEGVLGFVLRSLKLLRVVRLNNLFERLELEFRDRQFGPLKLGLFVVYSTHILSCTWQLAQQSDPHDRGSGMTWLDDYLRDLYMVLMTMTTVGYGDIQVIGFGSRVFAIIMMLVSPIFFGTIVSMLTHVTKTMFSNEADAAVHDAMRFMIRRQVPAEIRRRVEENLRHHLDQENNMSISPELLSKLSPAVQRELTLELLRSTVLQFPLFRDANHTFVAELAQAHSTVGCVAGDIIVEEGQLERELVFVLQGRLLVQLTSRSERKWLQCGSVFSECQQQDLGLLEQVEIESRAWFGEACLFDEGLIRAETAIALGSVELAVLDMAEYHRIVKKYPRVLERHEFIKEALTDGRLSLSELAYKVNNTQLERHNSGLKMLSAWKDLFGGLSPRRNEVREVESDLSDPGSPRFDSLVAA